MSTITKEISLRVHTKSFAYLDPARGEGDGLIPGGMLRSSPSDAIMY